MVLGRERKSPNDLLLFFDGLYLQTARAGRYKLHAARWNIPRYTAASAQQRNQRLARSELYDLTGDIGESYDLAADRPEIVRDLLGKIAAALGTFPEEIRQANAELIAGPKP